MKTRQKIFRMVAVVIMAALLLPSVAFSDLATIVSRADEKLYSYQTYIWADGAFTPALLQPLDDVSYTSYVGEPRSVEFYQDSSTIRIYQNIEDGYDLLEVRWEGVQLSDVEADNACTFDFTIPDYYADSLALYTGKYIPYMLRGDDPNINEVTGVKATVTDGEEFKLEFTPTKSGNNFIFFKVKLKTVEEEITSEKTIEDSSEVSSETSSEKNSEKSSEVSSEVSSEKSSEKSSEISSEVSSEPSSEKSSEKSSEISSEVSSEPSSEKSSEGQPAGGQPVGGQQVLLGTGTSSNNNTQPSGGQQQQQQSQPSGTTQTKVTASGNNTSSGNNTYDEEKEVKKQKDTVMVSINTQTGKIKKATIRGSAALRLDFIKFLKAHPEVELTYILDYKDRVYNIVLRGDDIVIDERVPYYGPEYLIKYYYYRDRRDLKGTGYVIQKGDTLSKLAAKFRIPIDVLAAKNGIKNKNLIIAGRLLYY